MQKIDAFIKQLLMPEELRHFGGQGYPRDPLLDQQEETNSDFVDLYGYDKDWGGNQMIENGARQQEYLEELRQELYQRYPDRLDDVDEHIRYLLPDPEI